MKGSNHNLALLYPVTQVWDWQRRKPKEDRWAIKLGILFYLVSPFGWAFTNHTKQSFIGVWWQNSFWRIQRRNQRDYWSREKAMPGSFANPCYFVLNQQGVADLAQKQLIHDHSPASSRLLKWLENEPCSGKRKPCLPTVHSILNSSSQNRDWHLLL